MADIWMSNMVKSAVEKADEANKRLDQVAPLVHELAAQVEKLNGELKAMKARMGKNVQQQ